MGYLILDKIEDCVMNGWVVIAYLHDYLNAPLLDVILGKFSLHIILNLLVP